MRRAIGIGVVGFGWMGQAHSRSYRRIPMHFTDRDYEPRLIIAADSDVARRDLAQTGFEFEEVTDDWRKVVDHPEVDVVVIAAPNMLHEEVSTAAAEAGRHVFCEKPVGGTPEETARITRAAQRAGVITGVGYNYRFVPLVQYAKRLIDSGQLGTITYYRGQFFSMYGNDPMGRLSWRYLQAEGGYGASADLLSHSVDLAHLLVGPITRVVGTRETFITDRPLPSAGGTHYDKGAQDDPTGRVTNEDYVGALVAFRNGARGVFESARSLMGPQSQNAFQVYGTNGAIEWNLETMNEIRVFFSGDEPHRGYTTVYGGEQFPPHGSFAPGEANGIGFEDSIAIEDDAFLSAVAADRPHAPGFTEALAAVEVQTALIRSWESEAWEDVTPLDEETDR